MPYTVKQVAKLSGISVRTLHYYDEIDLLKPAYCGDNQYRYYEEEQLLVLQQILFYRELSFPLNDIRQFLYSESFNKIEALKSHKVLLQGDLERVKRLIKTIDKTIAHLRGTEMINLEDIFDGFTDEKQKLYEDFLVANGISQSTINQARSKTKGWHKDQWIAYKQKNDDIHTELAQAIDSGLSPASNEVQALIARHYELVKVFWQPSRESYIGLSQLYHSNPGFIEFYNKIHPKLLSFITEAMEVFAQARLS